MKLDLDIKKIKTERVHARNAFYAIDYLKLPDGRYVVLRRVNIYLDSLTAAEISLEMHAAAAWINEPVLIDDSYYDNITWNVVGFELATDREITMIERHIELKERAARRAKERREKLKLEKAHAERELYLALKEKFEK